MHQLKINEKQKSLYREKGYWSNNSLLDYWNESVQKFGNREIVVDDRGYRYTYSQIDSKSDIFAAWLRNIGIVPGDVVSFQITPRSEFLMVYFGCLKAGAVAAPLGMCFIDDELVELLDLVESRVHISVSSYRDKDRIAVLKELRNAKPDLLKIVVVDDGKQIPEGIESFYNVMKTQPDNANCAINGDDLAVLLCTSGTTNKIRAVMLTHNNIIFSENGFNSEMGLTKDDIIFMPAPLSHATGFHHGIISPMLRGGKIVLQERFHCKDAIEIMDSEKCTYSMGATPFLYDVLKGLSEENRHLESLRFYFCGGTQIPATLVYNAWHNFGIRVCEVYGSTESVPHVFVHPSEAVSIGGHWSGRAMEGVEVRIIGKDGLDVLPGQTGEEISRGPNVFVGYYRDKKTTDAALDDDGWYYSGDLCIGDEYGNIKVVGRKKDIIIRGGENLNANKIDENLEGYDAITDHTVVGMPDERLVERICAYVTPKNSQSPTLESLCAHLKSKKVPTRYWPERLEVIDEIPRTESGKVKKFILISDITSKLAEEAKS